MRALRSEAQNYMVPVSESDHCAAIRRICGNISKACGSSLKDDRLRYGTVQKAFNLYLKFLWKLGKVAKPPHCPIDSIVLASAGINGSWTKSDCETEYLAWITKLKEKARSCDLATWEDQIWLQNRGAIQ
jgi:hypothetical protein